MLVAVKEMVKFLYVDGGEMRDANFEMEFGNYWTHIGKWGPGIARIVFMSTLKFAQ